VRLVYQEVYALHSIASEVSKFYFTMKLSTVCGLVNMEKLVGTFKSLYVKQNYDGV